MNRNEYTKTFALGSMIMWMILLPIFLILSILVFIVEPITEGNNALGYLILIPFMLFVIIFGVIVILFKTGVKITINKYGIIYKSICKKYHIPWNEIDRLIIKNISDYSMGGGHAYIFYKNKIKIKLFIEDDLKLFLSNNLENWCPKIYEQFIDCDGN